MATMKELRELGVRAMTQNPPQDFSVADVNGSFREEIRALAGDAASFRRNKLDLFELMENIINDVLPQRVQDRYGVWADFLSVPNGAKAVFKKRLGKARAKSFVTKVGLDGVVETFRLDRAEYEIDTYGVGVAAVLSWERFLAGQEDLAEYLDIILEGLDDYVFRMIAQAINSSVDMPRPENTKASGSDFDASKVDALINTVRAYGNPVLVCTPAFAATIPGNYVVANSQTRISAQDAEDVREYGYVKMYKGCPVMTIPNSFTDESNSVKTLSDEYLYIVPAVNSKLANVVLEGGVEIDEFKNKDRTIELSAYQKVGVGILHTNDWAIYQNTSLDA